MAVLGCAWIGRGEGVGGRLLRPASHCLARWLQQVGDELAAGDAHYVKAWAQEVVQHRLAYP